MKRPPHLWIALCIFVALLGIWLWQDIGYPHTIYEYHETGKVSEQYLDRASGLEIEAVPVFIPTNPLWVDLVRRWGIIAMILIGFYAAYIEIDFRSKAKERRSPRPS